MVSDKILDLSKSVYDLTQDDPNIADIMKSLGFEDIVKPGMLQTAGRFMTIPKGARLKGLDIKEICAVFESHGYRIQNSKE